MTPIDNAVRCSLCKLPFSEAAASSVQACPNCGTEERPMRIPRPAARARAATPMRIARADCYRVPWLPSLSALPSWGQEAATRGELRIERDPAGVEHLVIVRPNGMLIVVGAGASLLCHRLDGGRIVLSACPADELAAAYEIDQPVGRPA